VLETQGVSRRSGVRCLRIVGSYRGATGYDRHTREFVRGFLGLGVAVQLAHLDGWSAPLRPAGWEGRLDALDADVGADTVLHFAMPPHALPVAGAHNVNYTMFEADRLPPSWARHATEHDRIVVPTRACREVWQRSGIDARIAPLGVDARYFGTAGAPMRISDSGGRPVGTRAVRFLNVAELRPRKNHVGLLRTWIRATRPDDDAVLVLKLSGFEGDALERFAADVRDMEVALGRGLDSAAPVAFVAETLSDDGMRALYRAATHYLSLSHGEGWDQAAMEAAAAGLRLVVPHHTAYAEIYRDDEVDFVPARAHAAAVTGRTGAEDAVLFDGARWWTADEDAAVARIRGAIERDEPPLVDVRGRLASELTWERAARGLLDVLAESLP
jgi:glycosyltransferase involved in cell wall biosynthesis